MGKMDSIVRLERVLSVLLVLRARLVNFKALICFDLFVLLLCDPLMKFRRESVLSDD